MQRITPKRDIYHRFTEMAEGLTQNHYTWKTDSYQKVTHKCCETVY